MPEADQSGSYLEGLQVRLLIFGLLLWFILGEFIPEATFAGAIFLITGAGVALSRDVLSRYTSPH